jgi:hypothetical protein
MPNRRFVTIRSENSNQEIDLELPGSQCIKDIMPNLLKAIGWPEAMGEKKLNYRLLNEAGEELGWQHSLNEAGIENFDVLWIEVCDPELAKIPEANMQVEQELAKSTTGQGPVKGFQSSMVSSPSPEQRRGTFPLPIWVHLSIEQPSLVSESGVVFVLGQPPILIGRRSKDQTPGIDLSQLDTNFISSRQHARIERSGNSFAIQALKTKNGTFVNGVELPTGETLAVKDGDVLQFGFGGVRLAFRIPVKK